MNTPIDPGMLVVNGSMETGEVIGESTETLECTSCHHKVQVSGGMILSGSLSVIPDDAKSIDCPVCSGAIALGGK